MELRFFQEYMGLFKIKFHKEFILQFELFQCVLCNLASREDQFIMFQKRPFSNPTW